jgi:sugar phosphate isomerase/epimerase
MNYSFMSFSCPKESLDGMLALAKQYGYNGIEPRVQAGHGHGLDLGVDATVRREAALKAEERGIELCCIATSCRYGDPDTVQENVADTQRAIDLAADVGSTRIRVFGGKIGGGLSREAAIEQVSAALSAVADHAQERGVTVCLETHDDWTDPSHVAAVMTRVNHPAIAVNWDIMHPVRVAGWTVDHSFDALKAWVQHTHVHDGAQKAGKIAYLPMGTGIVDTRRAMELLAAAGYEGYLSGEWIKWEPPEVHLPREIETMKTYEDGI